MEWYKNFYTARFMDVVGFADQAQTQREVNFVQDVLQLTPELRVLDLCCGYGRHAKMLAEKVGCQVVGLDLSEDYLSIARREHSHPNIEYVHGDMRSLAYEAAFDAVINLFTSFGFFQTDEENEAVLGQVRKALKPAGRFLLDYENKFHFVGNDVEKRERHWIQGHDGEIYFCENRFDIHFEREIFKVNVMRNGQVHDSGGYDIRLYGLPEITRMLGRNGLQVIEAWGDYDGERCSTQSRRVIVLSEKQK